MEREWDEERLRKDYIEAGTEESQFLDYKAGAALQRSEGKKTEITKDVSAMANAAGGILIYGIDETDEQPSRPRGFSPVDPNAITKEWLAQVVNNISPHIQGLLIHPVEIADTPGLVFVVEVPESTTAHQALNLKYYKRLNFECIPLPDHEIRLIMHRGTTPVVEPVFDVKLDREAGPAGHSKQWLQVMVRNTGPVAVHHLKLTFNFPNIDTMPLNVTSTGPRLADIHKANKKAITVYGHDQQGISIKSADYYELLIECRSSDVLFPDDVLDFSYMHFEFLTSGEIMSNLARSFPLERFTWKLHADDMPPKTGQTPLDDLVTYGEDRWSSERAYFQSRS